MEIPIDDPKLDKARQLTEEIRQKNNDYFFLYSEIKRRYTKKEIDTAELLHLKIKTTFEPAGEECGTLYDEASCKICGANRRQIGPLVLKHNSIPKKDIAKTIAGEVVVSKKFISACKQRNLKGLITEPVIFDNRDSNFNQLKAAAKIELSPKTIAGINLFDLSPSCGSEIYKCPNGDTIGLNLLSEPYVLSSRLTGCCDFFKSRQHIGVTRGLLRPEPVYFCSQAFRKMVEEEKLTGFKFEIANVESE